MSVVATDGVGSTNNMFGTTGTNYNAGNSAPAAANLTPANGLSTAVLTTVTITFKINASTQYVPSTASTLTLTLN